MIHAVARLTVSVLKSLVTWTKLFNGSVMGANTYQETVRMLSSVHTARPAEHMVQMLDQCAACIGHLWHAC